MYKIYLVNINYEDIFKIRVSVAFLFFSAYRTLGGGGLVAELCPTLAIPWTV